MRKAVIGASRREPIDVKRALKAARSIDDDEELAKELVRIAIDVDNGTISALLHQLGRINDEMWRARALFSLFHRTGSSFAKELPHSTQDEILALVKGIGNEAARAAALRNLPSELPPQMRAQLAALGETICEPLRRLEIALHHEKEPSEERAQAFLATARAIDDEKEQGQALAVVARVLNPAQLEEAFAAAKAIKAPELAGHALVKLAARFSDDRRKQQAHADILAMASSIQDPRQRFNVNAALRHLPRDLRRPTESLLFDLATRIDPAEIRCRAMFAAGDFAQDEALRQRAFLAGIAAAECVWDEQRRAELLLLLRPAGPLLAPPVRRELTRAVGRLGNLDLQHELDAILGRFFIYERPKAPGESTHRQKETWDVFISFATADLAEARFVASELQSRGMRVFLSVNTIDAAAGSTGWMKAIDEALIQSRAVLVLLTPQALASRWVEQEWRKYYRLMVETEAGVLFSLRLGGPPITELPLTLRMYQCIDTQTGRIEPRHLTRIMDIVRGV